MQNRFVGDIGDFVKLGLLRALSPGYRLGVVWYLVADEVHNDDGRHIDYLQEWKRWRSLDEKLFDSLSRIVKRDERSIAALERENLLANSKFASEPLPLPMEYKERQDARVGWLKNAVKAVSGCNLVFLDPDNGHQPNGFFPTRKKAIKSVSFDDLFGFKEQGRTLIVYHHQTHREGGHIAEIGYNADRLRANGFKQVDALRASSYSPRAFFLLNATEEIRDSAAAFAKKWRKNRVTWYKNPAE
jgi:hypothetical protein